MVAEIDFRNMPDLGVTEFVVTIDPDVGLDPNDIEFVASALIPENLPSRVVRVVILSPTTSDRTLLKELRQAVQQRLRSCGKTVAWA